MDRFQEQYRAGVNFFYLNAADGEQGEQAFSELGLRGHPSIVILDENRVEIFRTFGQIDEAQIQSVFDDF